MGLASSWLATIITNPMQAADDLIVGGASGTPTRLPKGSAGQVLGIDSNGHVAWLADQNVTYTLGTDGNLVTLQPSSGAR